MDWPVKTHGNGTLEPVGQDVIIRAISARLNKGVVVPPQATVCASISGKIAAEWPLLTLLTAYPAGHGLPTPVPLDVRPVQFGAVLGVRLFITVTWRVPNVKEVLAF
mgnify:CR=1 FL=1